LVHNIALRHAKIQRIVIIEIMKYFHVIAGFGIAAIAWGDLRGKGDGPRHDILPRVRMPKFSRDPTHSWDMMLNTFRAVCAPSGSAKGDMRMAQATPIARITRHQYRYEVGPDIAPALEINPGQEVVVETMDCFSGAITESSQRFNSVADLLKVVPGLNPVTGPIAITGAEPGDVVAIQVLDIRVGMDGGKAITMILPDFGGLCNPHTLVTELGPDTKVCQIRGDVIDFPLQHRMVHLPVRPMIGTMWSAPARETRHAYVYDVNNGGNIDCPELGPGHTIYLPVCIPGGMVSLGDVHACMGDSEITGVAMETAADVHLRIDLVKAAGSQYLHCP
jgi:amidase